MLTLHVKQLDGSQHAAITKNSIHAIQLYTSAVMMELLLHTKGRTTRAEGSVHGYISTSHPDQLQRLHSLRSNVCQGLLS